MRKRGFSLIELAVVILIIAITAASVVWGIRGPLRRIGMRTCTDEIIAFDRLTRTYAQEQDRPVQLVMELDKGRMRRMDQDLRTDLGEPLKISAEYRLARLRMAGGDVGSGSAILACSARGLTVTYAVLLDGPGGRRQWIVFAGLTGQVWEPNDEKDLEGLFKALQAGPDAD